MEELGQVTLAEGRSNGVREGMEDVIDVDGGRRLTRAGDDRVAPGATDGSKGLTVGGVEEVLGMDGAKGDTDEEGDEVVTPVDVDLDEGDIGPGVLVDLLEAASRPGMRVGVAEEDARLGGHCILTVEGNEGTALMEGRRVRHASEGGIDAQHASGRKGSGRHIAQAVGADARLK
ncbi:MAG: hypothetical protein CMJ24_01050, partial [Phycisphaerae bacterium]|nr:hypothetical protein [Phycisphaerae bacterium]